jgi:hypothetical protein
MSRDQYYGLPTDGEMSRMNFSELFLEPRLRFENSVGRVDSTRTGQGHQEAWLPRSTVRTPSGVGFGQIPLGAEPDGLTAEDYVPPPASYSDTSEPSAGATEEAPWPVNDTESLLRVLREGPGPVTACADRQVSFRRHTLVIV